MLRRRNVNLKSIKQWDVFPKVPGSYRKQSAVGGTFSLFSFCVIGYLIYSEFLYFLDRPLVFKFKPDIEMNEKLQINIDMTVAMPCHRVGADVLDPTGQNVVGIEPLHLEETWWELSSEQQDHFELLKHLNSYLQGKHHALHQVLWKSSLPTIFHSDMPERTDVPNYPKNACRIVGGLTVNKVAGNFHITSGKSLQLPRGHIHISAYMTEKDYNFTHRINKLSFAEPVAGIVHPLDGEEKITNENMMLYQYFIEVVPTDVNIFMKNSQTYQYSVKDYERPINHAKGSHGIPGIFFKYDVSALRVSISQAEYTIVSFILTICAIICGVYVTSGIINSIVQTFLYIVCCRFCSTKVDEDKVKLLPGEKKVNLLDITTPRDVGVVFET